MLKVIFGCAAPFKDNQQHIFVIAKLSIYLIPLNYTGGGGGGGGGGSVRNHFIIVKVNILQLTCNSSWFIIEQF